MPTSVQDHIAQALVWKRDFNPYFKRPCMRKPKLYSLCVKDPCERKIVVTSAFFFFLLFFSGSSACTPLWEFWGCKNFSVQNPSEKSIPSFLPTQAVVTRASRALLPDKVGRGVKIHGKMGKPGPDAIFLGFCEIVGGSKKFSCARFFISHWGVFPRAKRAEKIFKVYLRERSERKITLSTHA